MKMKVLKYNVIFRSEPEGGFTATVPTLPGCITYGKDLTTAQTMVKDAIGGYVQSLKKHRKPVPTDDASFITFVDLTYAEATLVHA